MSWLKDKFAEQIRRAQIGGPPTFWNFERTPCTVVRVVVGESPPGWWCAELKGIAREAVRVEYRGQRFYLDNDAHDGTHAGMGWNKVTAGRGSPKYAHRSLPVERELSPGQDAE